MLSRVSCSAILITIIASAALSQEAPDTIGDVPSNHFGNLIDAIRESNDNLLRCKMLEGHLSTSLPNLANISYRLGRSLKFMGAYEKFANDSEADTMLTRNYRYPYIVPNEV